MSYKYSPIKKSDLNRKDPKYSGLLFDIEFIPPTEKEVAETEVLFTKDLVDWLLPRIQREVPELISYTDFFGEAEEYLRRSKQSWTLRKPVAVQMYRDFLAGLEEGIFYDETEQCLCIPQKFVTSFDYGDFYSPAYEIIRKMLPQWVAEQSQANKSLS